MAAVADIDRVHPAENMVMETANAMTAR